MLQVLRELEQQPITLGALKKALPHTAKVMLYDDLPERGSMADVFGKKDCIVLLYQLHTKAGRTQAGTGHYSTISKLGKGKFEFFSSYGMKPEEEIDATHSSGKLVRLLGKNYIRSSARLQTRGFHTNTCGRFAAARCLLKNVPLQVFVKHFSGKVHLPDPSDIITLATLFLFSS